jgi:hypothetical protein
MSNITFYTSETHHYLNSLVEQSETLIDLIYSAISETDLTFEIEGAYSSVLMALETQMKDIKAGFNRFKKIKGQYGLSVDEFNGGLTLSTSYAEGLAIAMKEMSTSKSISKRCLMDTLCLTLKWLYDGYGNRIVR